MTETDGNVRVVPVFFYVGICLYVASFFLSAIKAGEDVYAGWQCAIITFRTFPSWIFLPDLINPLAIVFMVTAILNRVPMVRRCLAIAILLLLIPTWLLIQGLGIMLGCAMWVVSLLLMVSGDLGAWKLRFLSGGNS